MEASAPPQLPTIEVEAWVCLGCGNYHASKSFEGVDLTQEPRAYRADPNEHSLAKPEALKVFGSRAVCPDCLAAGRGAVERKLVKLPVVVGLTQATPAA